MNYPTIQTTTTLPMLATKQSKKQKNMQTRTTIRNCNNTSRGTWLHHTNTMADSLFSTKSTFNDQSENEIDCLSVLILVATFDGPLFLSPIRLRRFQRWSLLTLATTSTAIDYCFTETRSPPCSSLQWLLLHRVSSYCLGPLWSSPTTSFRLFHLYKTSMCMRHFSFGVSFAITYPKNVSLELLRLLTQKM